jgi:hypothetical protein
MDSYALTALSRERRREIRAEYTRCAAARPVLRPFVARALRAAGDRLFRFGVALDRSRVPTASAVETPR